MKWAKCVIYLLLKGNQYNRFIPGSVIMRIFFLQLRKKGLEKKKSGFLFATAKVAYITAMIFLQIILHSVVHMYDFHIFIFSSSSFHGFITNQFNDLLSVGLLA